MQSVQTIVACGLVAAGLLAPAAWGQGQGKLAAAAPVTYNNRYEIYGGLNYETFQGGQSIKRLMNLGGVEAQGTYWLTNHLGVAADFRGDAGTTPVLPNPYFNGRALVVKYTGMLGVNYRGPKSQRFALDYHAFGGVSHGDFTRTALPAGVNVGLYTNRTKPVAQAGVSLDYNRSKRLAFRLSPDLVVSHFDPSTRLFFSISGGVLYRFGSR